MAFDFYVFKTKESEKALKELIQKIELIEKGKNNEQLKEKLKSLKKESAKLAENLVKAEPHLSYLWYEALENKNDKEENKKYSKPREKIRTEWQKGVKVVEPLKKKSFDFARLPVELDFNPEAENMQVLPYYSFFIELPFKLEKPFLSRDERDFYIIDNPLKRDKVFKAPFLAASGWKGALRAAMARELASWWQNLAEKEKDTSKRKDFLRKRLKLLRLFGTEKEAASEGYLDLVLGEAKLPGRRLCKRFFGKEALHLSGSLYFFPTFFEQVGLEVINPHDRKTGTVSQRGPLFLETVPQGAQGSFKLLYVLGASKIYRLVPFKSIMAYDLENLAIGIAKMLTVYGFGAKTSSGFGTASENLPKEGRIIIKIPSQEPGNCIKTFTFKNLKDFSAKAKEAAVFLREEAGHEQPGNFESKQE